MVQGHIPGGSASSRGQNTQGALMALAQPPHWNLAPFQCHPLRLVLSDPSVGSRLLHPHPPPIQDLGLLPPSAMVAPCKVSSPRFEQGLLQEALERGPTAPK